MLPASVADAALVNELVCLQNICLAFVMSNYDCVQLKIPGIKHSDETVEKLIANVCREANSWRVGCRGKDVHALPFPAAAYAKSFAAKTTLRYATCF